MSAVAEMVLEKCATDLQKWVVLVGDSKTYEHIQRVKKMYASSFENLIIFPGDWHLLKSFQAVLMTAYYHAGLRDIAKESGKKIEKQCMHVCNMHLQATGLKHSNLWRDVHTLKELTVFLCRYYYSVHDGIVHSCIIIIL